MALRTNRWILAAALSLGMIRLAAAGGLGTTSTSTSTTTSTIAACVDEVSLASVQCRSLLIGDILAARGAVRGNEVLQNQINRAKRNIDLSATLTGNKARSALKRAASALKSFNGRLRSVTGKRQVDPETRARLRDLSGPLEQAVKQLARQAG